MQLNSDQAIENGRVLRKRYGSWMGVLKAQREYDLKNDEKRATLEKGSAAVAVKNG